MCSCMQRYGELGVERPVGVGVGLGVSWCAEGVLRRGRASRGMPEMADGGRWRVLGGPDAGLLCHGRRACLKLGRGLCLLASNGPDRVPPIARKRPFPSVYQSKILEIGWWWLAVARWRAKGGVWH